MSDPGTLFLLVACSIMADGVNRAQACLIQSLGGCAASTAPGVLDPSLSPDVTQDTIHESPQMSPAVSERAEACAAVRDAISATAEEARRIDRQVVLARESVRVVDLELVAVEHEADRLRNLKAMNVAVLAAELAERQELVEKFGLHVPKVVLQGTTALRVAADLEIAARCAMHCADDEDDVLATAGRRVMKLVCALRTDYPCVGASEDANDSMWPVLSPVCVTATTEVPLSHTVDVAPSLRRGISRSRSPERRPSSSAWVPLT